MDTHEVEDELDDFQPRLPVQDVLGLVGLRGVATTHVCTQMMNIIVNSSGGYIFLRRYGPSWWTANRETE
jgi:predicted permease